jgi:hypothetical protein
VALFKKNSLFFVLLRVQLEGKIKRKEPEEQKLKEEIEERVQVIISYSNLSLFQSK